MAREWRLCLFGKATNICWLDPTGLMAGFYVFARHLSNLTNAFTDKAIRPEYHGVDLQTVL
jgi:hypothetical protein